MFKTIVKFVNTETGELLARDDALKNYVKIGKEEWSQKKRGNIIKNIIYECKRKQYRQTKLPF